MGMRRESFDLRIQRIEKDTKKKIKTESAFEQIIHAVAFTKFVQGMDENDCYVSTYPQYGDIDFHFENTKVDEFIEAVLGKLHQKWGIMWKLELTGEEKDPVFRFTPVKGSYNIPHWSRTVFGLPIDVTFRVKEGQFKTCKVEKIITKPEKIEWKEVKQDAESTLRLICAQEEIMIVLKGKYAEMAQEYEDKIRHFEQLTGETVMEELTDQEQFEIYQVVMLAKQIEPFRKLVHLLATIFSLKMLEGRDALSSWIEDLRDISTKAYNK